MNAADHKKIHKDLHRSLCDLTADFITQFPQRKLAEVTMLELMAWSTNQSVKPDHPSCKITRRKGVESL
jgi:hypothetical protein